jgi:outer membrane protein OmpA-like peptidoglycan-associated protein
MTRLPLPLARGLEALLLAAGVSSALACASVTTLTPEQPIPIQAQPPAPPLPDLPPVEQPPPPPRVTLEGELLTLDEALSFDEEGKLSAEHEDILAELAKWLADHQEVTELSVEVHSIGKGSRRAHKKRSQALAQQIVDALVAEGVDAARLVAASVGKSEDDQRHVALRVTGRAEPPAEPEPEPEPEPEE